MTRGRWRHLRLGFLFSPPFSAVRSSSFPAFCPTYLFNSITLLCHCRFFLLVAPPFTSAAILISLPPSTYSDLPLSLFCFRFRSKMESLSYGETIGEKFCSDCKTSKTPLWRSGPAGPKSLCNACGIRYRKKKSKAASPMTSSCCSTRIGEDDSERNSKLRKKLRIKLVALGKEVVLLRSGMKKVRRNEYRKLGEVEEAAFLLMSLSCGSSVFA